MLMFSFGLPLSYILYLYLTVYFFIFISPLDKSKLKQIRIGEFMMIYTVDLFASACVEHTSQSQIFNMLNICDFCGVCHVGSCDQQRGFAMVFSTAGKSLGVVARERVCL